MDIYVVWGFLGSGKTTFINYCLKHYFENKKVVIVENELGTNSIDSQLLRKENYEVVDLSAGCICCTLRAKLPLVIKEIETELCPDIVFVEASGIAQLDDLLPCLKNERVGVIALVGATHFDLLMKMNRVRFEQQYRLCHTILLTKTEQVATADVQRISTELLRINPLVKVMSSYRSLARVSAAGVFEESFQRMVTPVFSYNPVAAVTTAYKAITITLEHFYEREQIKLLIDRLVNNTAIGSIVRCKGFVRLTDYSSLKLDWVLGDYTDEILPEAATLDFCLVVIGEITDECLLRSYFLPAASL